jgi:mediator of RNA polymerase II transcription subunit 31
MGGSNSLLFTVTDLAQNRYFDDEAFVGYLSYLLYWKRPEYAKYVM